MKQALRGREFNLQHPNDEEKKIDSWKWLLGEKYVVGDCASSMR